MAPADPPPSLPSSWAAEESEVVNSSGGGRKVLFIILGVVVLLAVIGGALFALDPFASEERAWPAKVSGRPDGLGGEREDIAKVVPTVDPGVYIWSGFDGWHIWVVNGPGLGGVKGTLTTTDDRMSAHLAGEQSGTLTTEGKTTTFQLVSDQPVAGVDFEPGLFAKKLTITLEDSGGKISPELVHIGAKAKAEAVPVVIDKAVVND